MSKNMFATNALKRLAGCIALKGSIDLSGLDHITLVNGLRATITLLDMIAADFDMSQPDRRDWAGAYARAQQIIDELRRRATVDAPDPPESRDLREQLRALIGGATMTRNEIAERAGTPAQNITRFMREGNDLRASTIERYAAAMGYRVALVRDDAPTNPA